MKETASRLIDSIPKPPSLLIPNLALRRVTSRTGNGVYASADMLYKGAVFGRDSLEVAEDLLPYRPKLTHAVLTTMVRLQGTETNDAREEQPGKIVHEYRNVVVDGRRIDKKSHQIFTNLAEKWGGNEREMAYYGSIDATPLFLRVLGNYCLKRGERILDEKVRHKNGQTRTVRMAAQDATLWLVGQLDESKSGLLEYQRRNPNGIKNQAWKDSDEFYVHENGEMANHDQPIASIEVQGLAYDGLHAAARLFPDKADEYKERADKLRDQTIELLWQDDRRYFALGIDYDDEQARRIITTPTANPAALLDTGFFDELEPIDRQHYLAAIIGKIMSYEFLTDAGTRSRSLLAAHVVHFWDYHGSFVSWPKETYDIAKGLERQGFPQLARQLENRLLNVVLKHRQYPEFVYVDGWGRVMSSTPSTRTHGNTTIVHGTNNPERIQAWTVSAIMAIISRRMNNKLTRPKDPQAPSWQPEFEQYLLSRIPRINRHLNPFKLQAQYPTNRYRLQK